ncbi:MAG TPA: GGDEF domain-containing protein [Candidatus Saccharimonadales bacterium]|jgi:diguanylate cyclase (GGDEF)-like protein|nr:GGDEF domain-containing protein [Candidatus Saccharimonadales bacterium]
MTPRHTEHHEEIQLFDEPDAPKFGATQFRRHDINWAQESGDSESLFQITNDGINREEALEKRTKDHLTKLPMRWALLENINELIEKAENENETPAISVLFVDLINLKGVNDSVRGGGYSIGDKYIFATVRGIDANARLYPEEKPDRESDQIFRYGGDEIAVLIKGAVAEADLRRMGERYETAAHKEVVLSLGEGFVEKFGAGNTIGVATLRPGETAEEFLNRAGEDQQAQKRLSRPETEQSVGKAATSQ